MSEYGYEEELLAEIQLLGDLVDAAGQTEEHVSPELLDRALGLAEAPLSTSAPANGTSS